MSRKDHPLRPPVAPGWVVEQPPAPSRPSARGLFDALRPAPESRDVRAVLVAELATNFWPSLVIAATFVGIGLFAATTLDHAWMFAVTALGAFFAATKLALFFLHRRDMAGAPELIAADAVDTRYWDRIHALSGFGFAASVGILGAMIFAGSDRALQMLATGLLFAYCSGIVARVSVRPGPASAFLIVATLPVVIAAAAHREPADGMLAAMFAVFLVAALESIRHLHRAAARQIGLRLDMTLLAQHDPLTGLFNRLGLRQAFREMVRRGRGGPMLAVHCFDLDRFKPVNDRHGHPAGDMVLKLMAERLRGLLGEGSVAARIGGDEFVVLQYPIRQAAEAELFARRVSRAVSAPYQVGDLTVEIGVSLGFATAPPGPLELDVLLGLADRALYRMKLAGGGVARGEVG